MVRVEVVLATVIFLLVPALAGCTEPPAGTPVQDPTPDTPFLLADLRVCQWEEHCHDGFPVEDVPTTPSDGRWECMEEAGGENELHQYLRLEDDDSFALLVRVPGSAFITGHAYAVPDEGDEGEVVPLDERRFFVARGDQAFIHFPNIQWTEDRGYQVAAVGKSGTYHSDREELSVETAQPFWTYDRGESPADPDTTAHVYHRFVADETAYYFGAMSGDVTLQGDDFAIDMASDAMGTGGWIYIGTRSVEDTVLYGESPGCE